MLEESGFDNVTIGPAVDTFAGATGEPQARLFDVYGYAFLAQGVITPDSHPERNTHGC